MQLKILKIPINFAIVVEERDVLANRIKFYL